MTSAGKQRRAGGFTLAELAVSISVLVVLVGAMSSAVFIAGRAIPANQSLTINAATAVDAANVLAADLATALTINSATSTAIEFTVPDRGYGAAGPETIRFQWSGTPGNPLQRSINGGTLVDVAADVTSLSLTYSYANGVLRTAPRVLLIGTNPTSPSVRATATCKAMQAWGFSVQMFADTGSAAQLTTALQTSDVIYTLPEVSALKMTGKLTGIGHGVVVACASLYTALGVAASAAATSNDTISISAAQHPATAGLTAGSVAICSPAQSLANAVGPAAGATTLATVAGLVPAALAIERGGVLVLGTAAGRRVTVPSGTTSFDYGTLSSDGGRLERNAILWAATPLVVTGVRSNIQIGTDATGRVRSEVRLLNQPEAP